MMTTSYEMMVDSVVREVMIDNGDGGGGTTNEPFIPLSVGVVGADPVVINEAGTYWLSQAAPYIDGAVYAFLAPPETDDNVKVRLMYDSNDNVTGGGRKLLRITGTISIRALWFDLSLKYTEELSGGAGVVVHKECKLRVRQPEFGGGWT